LIAVIAIGSVSVLPVLAATSPASGTQISDLQAKASQLEQQISAATQQIGVLGQRYDQAQDEIQTLNAEIAATRSKIAIAQHHVAVDRVHLRTVAINSYVSGSSAGQNNPLFSGNQNTYAAQQEYGQVATGNLGEAVANLHTAEVQLGAAEANLANQDNQAQAEATSAANARAAAQGQQAQLNATLGQVKGQIGVLVAQQQAAAAAAQTARNTSVLANGATFPPPPPAGGAGAAVTAAESQLGVPYVWGGTSPRGTPGDPSGGFDCSGLVMYAWGRAGVSLPHFSGAQFDDMAPVPVSAMQPGDVLFYGPGGDEHEAMYVGGGEMIEAPETGEVVHITPVRLGSGFAGVRRP
jgi:cell wall-associated NlpC family hydrolase